MSRWPDDDPEPSEPVESRVHVFASGEPGPDGTVWLVDCNVCGPVQVLGPLFPGDPSNEVRGACAEHLLSHGVSHARFNNTP